MQDSDIKKLHVILVFSLEIMNIALFPKFVLLESYVYNVKSLPGLTSKLLILYPPLSDIV